jgi:hypothetical protein
MPTRPVPLQTSTRLMYAGIASFFGGIALGALFSQGAKDGFTGAGILLICVLLGFAGFVVLAVPAAVVSFVAARRDLRLESGGAILARWLVVATAILAAVLYMKELT